MEIKFLETAQNEFKEAVNYYNSQREGLGFEFVIEVKHTLKRIQKFPQSWHPLSKRLVVAELIVFLMVLCIR